MKMKNTSYCTLYFKNLKKMMRGQAVLEYLMVLGLVTFLSLRLTGYIGNFLDKTISNMAYVISNHLTVGVCQSSCFFAKYLNGIEN